MRPYTLAQCGATPPRGCFMTWPVCMPPKLPSAPTWRRASRTIIPTTCTAIYPASQVGVVQGSSSTKPLDYCKGVIFAFLTMIWHWNSLGVSFIKYIIKEQSTLAVFLKRLWSILHFPHSLSYLKKQSICHFWGIACQYMTPYVCLWSNSFSHYSV